MLSNLQSNIFGTTPPGNAQTCRLAGPFLPHMQKPGSQGCSKPRFPSLAHLEAMHLMHLHLYSCLLLHSGTGLRAFVYAMHCLVPADAGTPTISGSAREAGLPAGALTRWVRE